MPFVIDWGAVSPMQGLSAFYSGYMNARKASVEQQRLAQYQADQQMYGQIGAGVGQGLSNALTIPAQANYNRNLYDYQLRAETAAQNSYAGQQQQYALDRMKQANIYQTQRDTAGNQADLNRLSMQTLGVPLSVAQQIGANQIQNNPAAAQEQFGMSNVPNTPDFQIGAGTNFLGAQLSGQQNAAAVERAQQIAQAKQAAELATFLEKGLATGKLVAPPAYYTERNNLHNPVANQLSNIPAKPEYLGRRTDVVDQYLARQQNLILKYAKDIKPAEPPSFQQQVGGGQVTVELEGHPGTYVTTNGRGGATLHTDPVRQIQANLRDPNTGQPIPIGQPFKHPLTGELLQYDEKGTAVPFGKTTHAKPAEIPKSAQLAFESAFTDALIGKPGDKETGEAPVQPKSMEEATRVAKQAMFRAIDSEKSALVYKGLQDGSWKQGVRSSLDKPLLPPTSENPAEIGEFYIGKPLTPGGPRTVWVYLGDGDYQKVP